MAKQEDLRILQGGLGFEEPIPSHVDSPTWIVDNTWDKVKDVAQASLDAYMEYCKSHNLPHSYLLGLDILITGVAASDGKSVIDIRPTLLEGPCCNSYPACPNFFAVRLFKRLQKIKKVNLDELVEYPVHPLHILDKIVEAFQSAWKAKGNIGNPTIGVFTRPYPESEEEIAHVLALEAFKRHGLKAFRITPKEQPSVKDGKIWVENTPIDMCYRRIERIHVPMFYGWELAMQIINETPKTIWINDWKLDAMRSKTIEEKAFREWEAKTGKIVSRPKTLLGSEINPNSVSKLLETGGYALKKWDSTGGKGVFLHAYLPQIKKIYDKLYLNYNGRHMILIKKNELNKFLKSFENFKEDTAIQQMRMIDARDLGKNNRLVYDTRINALYDESKRKWNFISGISRSVPCGPKVKSGNSLLTNVSSGAEISPLIMGYTKGKKSKMMTFGPLLNAMLDGKTEWKI
ncbi:MAG: hypothetical protein V1709_05050 [Planctomycetota bacterium]